MELQKIMNSQSILKKNKARDIICPFKLHYKAVVIKTVWYCLKNIHRSMEQNTYKPMHVWSDMHA